MKILVTGGAGFIGSHITKQLIEGGHDVVVYDDFSTNSKDLLDPRIRKDDRVQNIEGNVRDSKLLLESLSGVDAVIHMASFISVEESVKDPLKYMENNVLGTASLLTAMREARVKKIVFSSSATVYGEPESLPVLEDAPLSAANPYAASKVASEALCESFFKTDDIDVTILRYFNPYGPGEVHDPETHAIPNFIKAAIAQNPNRKDLLDPRLRGDDGEVAGINKTSIPLYWKGEQIRDFIYVEDLASAHIAVLGLSGYNVFNVGSEKGVKIIDVVSALSDIFGYKLEVEDKGDRKGDVMANYASSEKLKKATGWEAEVSLEEGLRRTVGWFKDRN